MCRNYEIVVARMNREIAHRHRRQIAALVMGPLLAAIHGDPQPELGAEEQEILVDEILFEDVGIPTYRTLGGDERRPRRAEIGRFVGIWPHVAERVDVKRGVDRTGVEMARFDRRDPGVFREPADVRDHVRPRLATIACDLEVAVIRPRPNDARILG